MKKYILLTTAVLMVSCFNLQAQSQTEPQALPKWYLAPSAGVAFMNSNTSFYADITVGHYIDLGGAQRCRIDILGASIFKTDYNAYLGAALITTERNFGEKWKLTGSIGAGVQKSEWRNNVDFIIPVRFNFGYSLTKNLEVGVNATASLNTTDFKSGNILHIGLYLGIKF